jgi:hypothetical protein
MAEHTDAEPPVVSSDSSLNHKEEDVLGMRPPVIEKRFNYTF